MIRTEVKNYDGEKIGNFHGAAEPIETVIEKSAKSNKMPRNTPFSHNGTWEKGASCDKIFISIRHIKILLSYEKGEAYMKERLKRMLAAVHIGSDADAAFYEFGLHKEKHYDVLVVAPRLEACKYSHLHTWKSRS